MRKVLKFSDDMQSQFLPGILRMRARHLGLLRCVSQPMSPKGRKAKYMERQTAIVTGIGIGDEAKGATVEWLTHRLKAETNIRSGGPHGGAHIVKNDGREHMFSQFGAGTFEGAKTHLLNMVVSPWELYEESKELEKQGIRNPLERITIDAECVVLTPYHSAISRFREIMREEKKGTVGKGVGEAIRDSMNPSLTIRAKDFFGSKEALMSKINFIRETKLNEALEIMEKSGKPLPEAASTELEILLNQNITEQTADIFTYMPGLVKIVDRTYLDQILAAGPVVGESSQALLLHPRIGFVPHVTQADTSGASVIAALKERNYKGRILRFGVSRTYMIRHGAGPFVSYSPEMTKNIYEKHNSNPVDIPWLGEFKKGHYDVVAMKYAIEASGGVQVYDGLIINFLDLLKNLNEWQVVEAYEFDGKKDGLEDFFVIENGLLRGIKVHPDDGGPAHIEHLATLTKLLKNCYPVLKTLKGDTEPLTEVFIKYVESNLGVPVVATAEGPLVEDRKFRSGYHNLFT